MLEELEVVVASTETQWKVGEPHPDHPEAKHYVGTHHDWQLHIVDYGGTVDGGATSVAQHTAIHLTPALAWKAWKAAKGAVHER
jgi:hypothetical protein